MGIRRFRATVLVVATALVLGPVGISPAEARPAPAPTGLAAEVTGYEDGSYDIAATWDVVANATSYRVALTKAGATLASGTVTEPSWSPTVTATPGNASLSVRAVIGRKRGRTATLTVPLPDASAPRGSYSSSWDNSGTATITQETLSDNYSATSAITRTVDWGDETPPEAWTAGTTIDHTYPVTEQRYEPTVALEDEAHNVRVVSVPAIVINDTEAPSGSYSTGPATAWAKLTPVTITQSDIGDNWTPDALIARSVNWGDGSTTDWTEGTTVSHVYGVAGPFTPTVTLTDEAHNPSTVPTSEVVVTADTTGPTVRLTLPKAKHSVRAWKTLRGKALDAQTGVKKVILRAVEKRGTSWYGYNAVTKAWVKAATKAKAFTRSRPFSLTPDVQNRWSAHVAGLRKGTEVYRVRATDMVGNRSKLLIHQAILTKR